MKQISIVSDKRPELITEVTEILSQNGINILSIEAEILDDHSILILEVDSYDAALKIIQSIPNIQAISEEAILVRLKNEAGALAKIARRFTDAAIKIRSMRFIERNAEYGIVAIATERSDEALKLVADVLVA